RQGPVHGRGQEVAGAALPPGAGHLRAGRPVRPVRGRRLHQALGDGRPDGLGGPGAAPQPRPGRAAGGRGQEAHQLTSAKLWGSRFKKGLLPELETFTSSLEVDYELLRFDVAGSIAHARGLRAAGLLTAPQLRSIERGLRRVLKEAAAPGFEIRPSDEDVHTLVERRLTEIDPDAGARLHTGRSRNDQVALDLRLWCRAACAELGGRLAALAAALAEKAQDHADWPMPGYTHLQRAQPVTVGHHLLAHAEPLLRDAERVRHAYACADALPLGAGALAGSTLPLRREVVARELGFGRVLENSMDAVAD